MKLFEYKINPYKILDYLGYYTDINDLQWFNVDEMYFNKYGYCVQSIKDKNYILIDFNDIRIKNRLILNDYNDLMLNLFTEGNRISTIKDILK